MKNFNDFTVKQAKRAGRVAMLFTWLCAAATAARATIITFSGGSGYLTSPYYENGFVVTVIAIGGNEDGWAFANGGLMDESAATAGLPGIALIPLFVPGVRQRRLAAAR